MTEDFTAIKEKAAALGVPEWAEKIEEWQGQVEGGAQWNAATWYVTDLRHLSNLSSPRMQGYITEDTPPARWDALTELGDMIYDYIDDQFEDE